MFQCCNLFSSNHSKRLHKVQLIDFLDHQQLCFVSSLLIRRFLVRQHRTRKWIRSRVYKKIQFFWIPASRDFTSPTRRIAHSIVGLAHSQESITLCTSVWKFESIWMLLNVLPALWTAYWKMFHIFCKETPIPIVAYQNRMLERIFNGFDKRHMVHLHNPTSDFIIVIRIWTNKNWKVELSIPWFPG